MAKTFTLGSMFSLLQVKFSREYIAMAKPESVADKALKKLAEQLKCSICHESFTDPKLLQCFHVFCKNCLESTVLQDEHGLSLCCPNCRRSTLLPEKGVSDLQPAFHIHHMLEIQDALQKVKQGQEGQKTLCEKCKKKSEANGFCRDCGKFVCKACIEVHAHWDEYSTHKVISIEQLESDATEMVHPTKKTLYCPKHPGKELDLFCETDLELICRDCIVKTHKDHEYELVNAAIPKHRDILTTHLEPVKENLSTVIKAMQDLDTTRDQIMNQRAAIEADIQEKIEQLQEALAVRKTKMITELDKDSQLKLKKLSSQRDELELIQTRLNSCVEFVSDSLKTGSDGEILAMEKSVLQQVKEMCEEFNSDRLPPQVLPDMILTASSELLPACQQFGQVCISQVCPEKCYATGKGLEVATVGEYSTVTVHTMNREDSKCSVPLPDAILTSELVSSNAERMTCDAKLSDINEYEINYQPTRRGRYQLHIKVSNQDIRGSPFLVVALKKFGAPVRSITGLSSPAGVAIDKKGQVIIAEEGGNRISIYSPSGDFVKSFGRKGSAPGQFKNPCGVAVDRACNIFVAEAGNHRIQKFTADGEFVASVEIKGITTWFWTSPPSIGIGPSDEVYVCDNAKLKHEVQILNSDLSLKLDTTFGSRQLSHPWDVAFDSRGNVYIADFEKSNGIHVFTKEGHYVREFKTKGSNEKLTSCAGISIDTNDVVYVTEKNINRVSLFTTEGQYLTSFGTQGELTKPYGIAVDKDGLVYICDSGNNRLQIW